MAWKDVKRVSLYEEKKSLLHKSVLQKMGLVVQTENNVTVIIGRL